MATHLTKRYIEKIKPPAKGYKIWYDDEVKGFGIRITAKGARTFILNYYVKDGGTGRCHERRMRIGPYPSEWSVEAARLKASEMKRGLVDGIDPLDKRDPDPEPEHEPMMKELADDYLAQHAIPHKRPSSVKQDRRMLQTRVLPVLGAMKVPAVGVRHIEKLHNTLKATPYEANRVRSLLSKMFSLAIRWGMRPDGKNPCKGIPRFHEAKHEAWLTGEQLQRLELALNEYPVLGAADALRLLMLTGSREGEVLNAQWTQFDLKGAVWTKPSHATKQAKPEHLPLGKTTMVLLRRMEKQRDPEVPWLFPRSDDASKPRTTVRDCWEIVCRKAGLAMEYSIRGKRGKPLPRWKPTARINDLRHSFASHLVQRGKSLVLVGKLIGHTHVRCPKCLAVVTLGEK